ncbi:hypothetical protein DICPUDRAFT_93717 [Dictyostelium purpureum]|uniref:Aldehyde dehydrogenase n=1 Tax=Dictyostelium purpureum TaxID=5786 RepID=F0ZAV3_DICPU|nr:uncharacterized protein DICPUDRAFT_93717 [Dictyostelium purpureum]EGC38954.1 hypothetical protein DICPUDRAFT_93717 [Dictyostelium purpureum]|eukprot:XP_003284519.1 hypothetical protein DICPUDRAFT_93717 [Dictyostelium purpureum]
MENKNYLINLNGELEIEDKYNLKFINNSLRKIYNTHKSRDIKFRISQLKALEKLLIENKENLVNAVKLDLGKHEQEASMVDYAHVMRELKSSLNNIKSWTKNKKIRTPLFLFPCSGEYVYDPYGVVLIIAPWNYPINLALVPLIGAITGGNCAFLKTSRHCFNTSSLLCSLLKKYLDNECYKCDFEGGADFITEIIKYKWDNIFFTGSVAVGRIVYEAAAKHLTPVTLELGGKNPTIIDRNMDLSVITKRIIYSKCFNAGQICISTDYIFVPKEKLEELITEIKIALHNFYGDDIKSNKDYGRIVSVHHTKRLQSLFQYGKVVIGGECDIENKYISPTVIVEPEYDSPLMNDEIFGPVISIITYDSLDEVFEYLVGRPSPLVLYLFSNSKKTQKLIMNKIPSGNVLINDTCTFYVHPNLLFGGFGDSGIGSYHGKKTFRAFTHKKSVMYTPSTSILDFINILKLPPYTKLKQKTVLTLLEKGI